ncbi:ABC1 kinase family protein [Oceanisphaera avium]|uniref:Ubiquinol-cytochrome C reductase n=1 Tax=Oceanisphaera avium TaxID=1903694 RepID=A0A1Y0CXY8_9GAMM|nr:AarF/ABC1/UbiB kinase family protein [Oceanisphaera avium]ART80182.1 ubiquinol-cytochrome C reductase [Oceanisphaera avium]
MAVADNKGSPIPKGRLRRMASLASLAARVSGGMLGEGARQWARGKRPSTKDLLLTPANASRITEQLAQLRGAAMKVGQLLSMDAGDLLPPELTLILSRLQSNGTPMPARQLSQVLAKELGENWQHHFAQFSFKPMAAASIGQVHLAHADDGRKLAIKVQYPGVSASIDSDVDNVLTLLKMSRLLPEQLDYSELLNEAKRQLHAEADYILEAQQLAKFASLLADEPQFVLPRVDSQLSSSRLLTMTYMEGVALSELQQQPQRVRNSVISQLFRLLFKELFEFRLVQTDPNFANYLYQPESQRLVLLDFGATRTSPSTISEGYRQLLTAGLNNDEATMEQALSQIGFFSQDIKASQRQAVVAMVQLACEPVRCPDVYDFANSTLAIQVRDAGSKLSLEQGYWHTPPADALFLHRKIGGLYLLAAKLNAQVNVQQLLRPYLII